MIKQLVKKLIPPSIWTSLVGMRYQVSLKKQRYQRVAKRVGYCSAVTLFVSELKESIPGGNTFAKALKRIQMRGYKYPLYYRDGTSDRFVINQVFANLEYECIGNMSDVSLIIDCGANIGCTSFYLLHRYPNARLIAIEPDEGNFLLCQKNLRPFLDRVTMIKAGVWSSSVPLRVERGSYRDGREWSFQVRPAQENQNYDFLGITIDDILKTLNFPVIDILKVDIEAAESEVFSKESENWLEKTRHIAIELHGADCERVFHKAVNDVCWKKFRSGELTICRRSQHDD